MRKIIIISFTDLSKDPRVNRQIRFLNGEYEVTAVGTKNPEIEGVKFIDCGRTVRYKGEKLRDIFKLLSKRYEWYYWSAPHIKECLKKLSNLKTDIIIANDIDSLPLALKISNGAKVVFDAHEYAPKEFEDIFTWRLLYQDYKKYLCSKYINKVNAMMTVCNGISQEYKEQYGVKSVVVTNAPAYKKDINVKRINNEEIKMIFHGGANQSRKIENMIEMMKYIDDRFSLDLVLVGKESYINKLKKLSGKNKKIRFLKPVPMQEISKFISQYDIGVYLLEPNSFNNKMALPNKLFEFIQARLVVAIGPSLEMAQIVKKFDCGIVSEDFNPISLAKSINTLDLEKINYYKEQSDKTAKVLCAETNCEIVRNLIKNI